MGGGVVVVGGDAKLSVSSREEAGYDSEVSSIWGEANSTD